MASNGLVKDADIIAEAWVTRVNASFTEGNLDAFLNCIDSDGWLRDYMAFQWECITRHGHQDIKSYLSNSFAEAHLSNLKLDTHEYGKPALGTLFPGQGIVSAALTFETLKALGNGYVRILLPKKGESPKALTLLLALKDWKGKEEADHEAGIYEGHTVTWQEVHTKRKAEIEADPHVIISAYIYTRY